MHLNDYPKCITKNESNIPILKSSGRKRSKPRSQFPELQKYIETIIKASNACDSEDASDGGEKTSKAGKSGKIAIQTENKKVNKRKLNLNLNSEKVSERTKTTVSVSSRENISNQFFSDFEDPRNWDVVTTQNDFHKNIKIEKALKNLFPNPYKLLQIPELKKPKISLYIEKIENGDVTLHDVNISEFDAQKTIDSTRVESIFEADCDKISTHMESWSLSSRSENQHCNSGKNSDKKVASFSDGLTLNTTSNYFKNLGSDKSNHSASRQSSSENVKECDSIRNEKKLGGTWRASKNRKSTKEQFLDYDIGKLKLLTLTDSDESTKDSAKETGKKLKEDLKNRINKIESSRVDKLEFSLNGKKESIMVRECFNELSYKHKVNQRETRNRSKSDGREQKTAIKSKIKRKNFSYNSTDTEDCSKTAEEDFDNDEEPKSERSNIEAKEEESSELEERKSKGDVIESAGEKIDEVLQFMCDCLMKFKRESISTDESPEKNAEGIDKARGEWPNLEKPFDRASSKFREGLLPVKQSEVPQVLFHVPSSQRLKAATHSLSEQFHILQFDREVVRNPNVPETVYPDSLAINNENVVQTVETQNELGGYIEEQRPVQVSTKDYRLAKSVLPLPVKIKQRKVDTQKVLKRALEREERLLNGEFNKNKMPRNDFFEKPVGALAKKSQSFCSVVGAFKRPHSNFVICVNSLPRNMRTGKFTSFSFCPWAISLDGLPRSTVKPLPYYRTLRSVNIKLSSAQLVRRRARKDETMLVMYRSAASHTSSSVGVSFIVESSKVYDEIHLKNSESLIINKYKPMKKSFFVKPSTPPKAIGCIIESCEKVDLEFSSNLNDQIGVIEDAVKQTEKVYFLEQNSNVTYTVSDSSSGSRNEVVKSFEWDEEIEKRKLHDLLVRTYDLQHKLKRHLKILNDKPVSISCPSIQQKTSLDFKVASKSSESAFRAADVTSEDAMVYWYLQTPQKSSVLDEAVLVKIPKTDRGTSYDPPPEVENADSGDDDRSSTYSFKSSNDFSENEKELKVPQPEENPKNARFMENVFKEIDLFKSRIMLKRDKERGSEIVKNERKDGMEMRLAKPCKNVKTQAKLLKTVFKGKKSTTELSLGLKAVPLVKVSNISVEKRKISENHTKISICIAKEKANEFPQGQSTSNDLMRSRLSYYLDSMKPSLSSCRTDYSKPESEARREESEDEEDDFKSVLSNLSRSHSEKNLANEVKEVKKTEAVPPKSFAKHRFDFYQKMNTSHKARRKSLSNTSCTYKEFEPLRQALTEMQIRMRSIKRDAYFSSNDYYQRALKLAKMSAGFCQSCGSRSVIPQDTFGYYKTILPRNQSHQHHFQGYHLKAMHPRSSYYSLGSRIAELNDQFGDLNLQKSSSYSMNSSRTIIRNLLNESAAYSGIF